MKRTFTYLPPLLLLPLLSFAGNGFFVTANLGSFDTQIGQQNTYHIGPARLAYTYFNTEEDKQRLIYGLGLGYQKQISTTLHWRFSLNFSKSQSRTLKGYFGEAREARPMFYYQFKVASQAILIRNDLVYQAQDSASLWHKLQPYVGFSIGSSQEEGYGYQQSSTREADTPHGNQNTINLAYGFDGGLLYQINTHNSVSAEFQYLNLGRATLGPFRDNGLYTKKIKGLVSNVSYSYCF